MSILRFLTRLKNRLRNLAVAIFNRENGGQRERIHLVCEEGDSFKTRLALGGATHKRGIILNTIIVHQIAKRESVTEEDNLAGSTIGCTTVLRFEFTNLGDIGGGIRLVGFGIRGIDTGKRFGDFTHQGGSVVQREPNMLIVFHFFVMVMFMFFCMLVMIVFMVVIIMFFTVFMVMFHALDNFLLLNLFAEHFHQV